MPLVELTERGGPRAPGGEILCSILSPPLTMLPSRRRVLARGDGTRVVPAAAPAVAGGGPLVERRVTLPRRSALRHAVIVSASRSGGGHSSDSDGGSERASDLEFIDDGLIEEEGPSSSGAPPAGLDSGASDSDGDADDLVRKQHAAIAARAAGAGGRRCSNCHQLGHYASTCKNAAVAGASPGPLRLASPLVRTPGAAAGARRAVRPRAGLGRRTAAQALHQLVPGEADAPFDAETPAVVVSPGGHYSYSVRSRPTSPLSPCSHCHR